MTDAESQGFEAYRPLLFSIAYRMLGSAMEAEDIVQEAYLRYKDAPHDTIQSPKAYLTTIVTHLCLDHLKSAKVQREQYIGTWLPEPVLTAPSPSAVFSEHENISMAFLVLLENLSPIERAIFILRDVFDYRYAEIAPMIGKSEANCRRYYRQAKKYLMEHRPHFEPPSPEQRQLAEHFWQALSDGNVEGLTDMLVDEAKFYGDGGGKAPAVRDPVIGREAVIRFLFKGVYNLIPSGVRMAYAEVNQTPAFVFWQGDQLIFVMNFTMANNRIESIRNILNPDKLQYLIQHYEREGNDKSDTIEIQKKKPD